MTGKRVLGLGWLSRRSNSFSSVTAEHIVRASFQAMIKSDKLVEDFLTVLPNELPYRMVIFSSNAQCKNYKTTPKD